MRIRARGITCRKLPRNGIQVGAYFFSSAVTEQEAAEEAGWVTGFIARYKITYPVAYNCEDFQSEDSRQYGLSKEERTGIACAFLDAVQSAGYTPMFYASRNEMEGSAQWDMETLGSKYRIWVSQYPEVPFPQTPSSTYSGAIPCGSTPAGDRSRGSMETWI